MLGYGNGRWMAMGVGASYTSTDGREWTPSPMDRDAVPELRGGFVETGGGEWWAINWKDQFEFSPNGLDWSAKAESLYGMKDAGPVWVVGPEGLRTLAHECVEQKLWQDCTAVTKAQVDVGAVTNFSHVVAGDGGSNCNCHQQCQFDEAS